MHLRQGRPVVRSCQKIGLSSVYRPNLAHGFEQQLTGQSGACRPKAIAAGCQQALCIEWGETQNVPPWERGRILQSIIRPLSPQEACHNARIGQ